MEEYQTIVLNGTTYNLVPKRDKKEEIKEETPLETLKNKFESGNYLVMFKPKNGDNWHLSYRPNTLAWRKDFDYELMHKKHEEVLQAYIKDRDIRIEFRWYDEDWMLLEGDFIENYDENMQLRLAEKPFQPFTLNIEVNSLTNLKRLWNQFNINEVELKEVLLKSGKGQYQEVKFKDDFTYNILCDIDDKLEEYLGEN